MNKKFTIVKKRGGRCSKKPQSDRKIKKPKDCVTRAIQRGMKKYRALMNAQKTRKPIFNDYT